MSPALSVHHGTSLHIAEIRTAAGSRLPNLAPSAGAEGAMAAAWVHRVGRASLARGRIRQRNTREILSIQKNPGNSEEVLVFRRSFDASGAFQLRHLRCAKDDHAGRGARSSARIAATPRSGVSSLTTVWTATPSGSITLAGQAVGDLCRCFPSASRQPPCQDCRRGGDLQHHHRETCRRLGDHAAGDIGHHHARRCGGRPRYRRECRNPARAHSSAARTRRLAPADEFVRRDRFVVLAGTGRAGDDAADESDPPGPKRRAGTRDRRPARRAPRPSACPCQHPTDPPREKACALRF